MKIAVTSQGMDLQAQVDPRFGRCAYFIVYDVDSGEFETIDNATAASGSGAGIQAAQKIVEKKVEAVLTGNIGPNAFKTLSAAGIQLFANVSGSIAEAIDVFRSGSLKPYETPTVESHFGISEEPATLKQGPDIKRIAVASDDDGGLEAKVSAHFGRCPFYTIIEVEGKTIGRCTQVENPFFNSHGVPGQVPEFIRDQDAHVIIAGGMGQRAVEFFQQFGIDVATGAQGKVKDAVAGYLEGSIQGYSPCNHDHDPCH